MATLHQNPAHPTAQGRTHDTAHDVSHDKAHDARHAPHVHGDMDITAQQRGFAGFVRFATWNVVAIAVILIFLALANA